MGKAPHRGCKAIGFDAEYFPSEGLINGWVAIVAVRRAANRNAVFRIYVAPSKLLRLSPVMRWQKRINQLRDLSKITQRALGHLHIVNDARAVDETLVAQNGITRAFESRSFLA